MYSHIAHKGKIQSFQFVRLPMTAFRRWGQISVTTSHVAVTPLEREVVYLDVPSLVIFTSLFLDRTRLYRSVSEAEILIMLLGSRKRI